MKTKKMKKGGIKATKRKKYIYNCFTLTEILVVIAIVGILASVALVSIGAYRAKGQSEKVKASLGSVVTSMTSCWSMGGQAKAPTKWDDLSCGSSDICWNSSSYGKWPDLSKIGDYVYTGESNANWTNYIGLNSAKPVFSDKGTTDDFSWLFPAAHAAAFSLCTFIPEPPCFLQNNWYFSAASEKDQKKICCNQKMKGCKIIDYSATCDNTVN
jgi:prepilin-type N-terminal cleavage/methylation domain-containing protein